MPGRATNRRARTCHGPGGAGGCGGWQDQAVGPGVPLALAVGRRRYLQVELVLGTSDTLVTPQVDEVTLVYTPDADGARVTKYYYSGGRRIAMRTPDGVYYLHGDHLGSTSLVTTGEDRWVGIVEVPAGSVWTRQLYHPFGTVRYAGGTLPTDFGFTGQRAVAGTGLMYYKARYYHSGLGRFVSPDTIVPNSTNPELFNRYAYAGNNPLAYYDPTGHWPEWFDRVMGGVSQYLDDMSFGAFSALTVDGNLDYVDNAAFQEGREVGRAVSTAQGVVETAQGVAIASAGLAAGPPTMAAAAACTAGTAGACALPSGVVLTAEGAMVIGGALEAAHGGIMLARIRGNPVGSGSGGRGRRPVPLKGGRADLPSGIEWANVDELEHLHPPDVEWKLERAHSMLKQGFDPNHPIVVMRELDGTLVVVQGNHRLAVVKEMGYDLVPVRILDMR